MERAQAGGSVLAGDRRIGKRLFFFDQQEVRGADGGGLARGEGVAREEIGARGFLSYENDARVVRSLWATP